MQSRRKRSSPAAPPAPVLGSGDEVLLLPPGTLAASQRLGGAVVIAGGDLENFVANATPAGDSDLSDSDTEMGAKSTRGIRAAKGWMAARRPPRDIAKSSADLPPKDVAKGEGKGQPKVRNETLKDKDR